MTGAAGKNHYLTGQLLVATRDMGDPRFVHTVVYIIHHDNKGAMGFIINRPIAKGSISAFLTTVGVKIEDTGVQIVLHYGGPMEREKGFVLHTDDYHGNGTQVIGGGVAVTADTKILRAMAREKGPRRSLVVMGYSGWAPGQLEGEIAAKAWFVIPEEEDLIFDEKAETKWERAEAKRRIPL